MMRANHPGRLVSSLQGPRGAVVVGAFAIVTSGVGDYVGLAQLVAATATVGGAPGSAIGSDAAGGEPAYGYRRRDR
jgi:hypothetical protein